MMKLLFLCVSMLVLAAGCQGTERPASSEGAGKFGDSDQKFLRDLSDREVDTLQISKLASEKASEDHIRSMAQNNVKRQEPEIAKMKSWLQTWYGDRYEAHPTAEGEKMFARLQTKSGNDFDKEYLTDMIDGYRAQVELAKPAAEQAKHQEVKDLAQSLVKEETHLGEHLKEHLEEAKGKKTDGGNPDHDH